MDRSICSGVVREPNRATTRPVLSMRNLVKFQAIRPVAPGWLFNQT